ncbi:metal-sensing transcriptional repressor [Rhodococcus sp. (in: high G+C Gram-positive bacteria)]|uniref:metal-sensing transcriptional repressor n=1 Tax=Rhodococcus sp. TaxID=1831 RepID=UPI003BB060A3
MRMLESDRYCVDVLQQPGAAEGALAGLGERSAKRMCAGAWSMRCVREPSRTRRGRRWQAVFGARPPAAGGAVRAIP